MIEAKTKGNLDKEEERCSAILYVAQDNFVETRKAAAANPAPSAQPQTPPAAEEKKGKRQSPAQPRKSRSSTRGISHSHIQIDRVVIDRGCRSAGIVKTLLYPRR